MTHNEIREALTASLEHRLSVVDYSSILVRMAEADEIKHELARRKTLGASRADDAEAVTARATAIQRIAVMLDCSRC
jgi:hypothetical protein